MTKNSNGIIKSMVIIAEKFKVLNITEDDLIEAIDAQVYLHLFENVEDFRQQGKMIYRLDSLLLLILFAILGKCNPSFTGVEDYIEANVKKYERYGLIKDGQCPSHDTIRRVLDSLDNGTLRENTINAFYNYLKHLETHTLKQGDYKHFCFDGKEMRGSGRSESTQNPKRNISMLNIYDSCLYTALISEPIEEKENEIPVVQRLLPQLCFKKSVLTADALHCQKKTAELISDGKGVYLLTVKDNQPLLLEEIKARFENPRIKIKKYTSDDRTFEIINLPSNYALKDEWKGLKSFTKMTSTKNKRKTNVRYFISNTQDERLIIDGIEERWSIENGFHKPKDIDLYEDGWRTTSKNALKNIATLNNLALLIIHMYATISGKIFRKAKVYVQNNAIDTLNFILGTMSSEEITERIIKELDKR